MAFIVAFACSVATWQSAQAQLVSVSRSGCPCSTPCKMSFDYRQFAWGAGASNVCGVDASQCTNGCDCHKQGESLYQGLHWDFCDLGAVKQIATITSPAPLVASPAPTGVQHAVHAAAAKDKTDLKEKVEEAVQKQKVRDEKKDAERKVEEAVQKQKVRDEKKDAERKALRGEHRAAEQRKSDENRDSNERDVVESFKRAEKRQQMLLTGCTLCTVVLVSLLAWMYTRSTERAKMQENTLRVALLEQEKADLNHQLVKSVEDAVISQNLLIQHKMRAQELVANTKMWLSLDNHNSFGLKLARSESFTRATITFVQSVQNMEIANNSDAVEDDTCEALEDGAAAFSSAEADATLKQNDLMAMLGKSGDQDFLSAYLGPKETPRSESRINTTRTFDSVFSFSSHDSLEDCPSARWIDQSDSETSSCTSARWFGGHAFVSRPAIYDDDDLSHEKSSDLHTRESRLLKKTKFRHSPPSDEPASSAFSSACKSIRPPTLNSSDTTLCHDATSCERSSISD